MYLSGLNLIPKLDQSVKIHLSFIYLYLSLPISISLYLSISIYLSIYVQNVKKQMFKMWETYIYVYIYMVFPHFKHLVLNVLYNTQGNKHPKQP